MPEILLVAAVCAMVMTLAFVWMLRPVRRGETLLRALLAGAGATSVAVSVGGATRAETVEFLLAASFAVAPLSVVVGATAQVVSPKSRGLPWALVGVWSLIVYPACVIVPPLVFEMCHASECRVQDFGGGLALLVSAAAAVVLARQTTTDAAPTGWAQLAMPVLGVWAAAVVWLASLEGVVDAYTPRILLAAVVAPIGGAIAWVVVDVLHGAAQHPLRSAADGVLAGIIAIVPGAASVSFPWSLMVGALAGAAGAIVFRLQPLASTGRVVRWALVVLTTAAIGYLAPAVVGDSLGFMFSGRITAVVPPALAFLAVVAVGVLATGPIWARGGSMSRVDSPRR